MSYTTVKAIWPGVKTEDLEKLRNSWGSAPLVWNVLCKKYFGARDGEFLTMVDRLWPLWEDLSIPRYHRSVLMMTFDRAYVTKKDYARMARDIGQFLVEFNISADSANHWPRIKEIFDSNPDIPAIGLYCTSVSEDPFQGEWNEEKEEYDPPDWGECYDIYAELDELKSNK